MDVKLLVLLVSSLSINARVGGVRVDQTIISGAYGVDVVRAVISKIETSNSFINFQSESAVSPFMRTMAYVETRDGNLTSENGGGIWNVNEALFNSTQSNVQLDSVIMQLQQENSQNHVRPVNWRSLTYANLSIPLYSGLAVRMLIHLNRLPVYGMYAAYWNDVFKGSRSNLNQWNDGAHRLTNDEVCKLTTDLVFVLDESGSIGRPNFQEVKTFVYNFSRNFLTDMTRNRVGVITFASQATEHIALNNTIEDNELHELIINLSYIGQGTNTALGLELMRQQDWSNEISVLRLAIVLTDGQSNNKTATLLRAQEVHAHEPPIVVYAIGIGGNTDQQELEAIASGEEFVTHLDSFDPNVLESTREGYSYQICFTATQTVTVSMQEEGEIEMGVTTRLRYTVPVAEGMTFRLCLRNGQIIIYASTLPNPSSAQYTWRDIVTASAQPISCLTMFYELRMSEDNKRRKRRQLTASTASLYITLEGQGDKSEFIFNSSVGNVTFDVNECEDKPCDPNADCYNTDGYFYCLCFPEYTGNGSLCTPGKVEVKDNTTAITVSVILVITIIVTIIIILFVLNFTRKKHCQPKRQNLIDHEVNTEPDGPLEFDGEDEKMYEQKKALGCQRLVPTRVEQFEAMASGTVNAPEPEDMVNDEYDQAQNLITRID